MLLGADINLSKDWSAADRITKLHLLNATSPHELTGRMKVMLVEHHKMLRNPFPLESNK